MPNKLRVALIGVGGIARAHVPGWKSSPHAELIALADSNAEILRQKGQEWEIARLYNDVESLLAAQDIDVVDICVPNRYHAPMAIAALTAGKHVMCEKPLAPTPEEIRGIIEARDRSGRLLMTAQNFRFDARSLALKAEVDKRTLGNIYHARCWMLRRAATPCRTSFTLKQHSGGGPCIDLGVHILDLTMWMMGMPKPVTVSGVTHAQLHKQPGAFSVWGGALPREWDVEEFATALVRFNNEASLVLEVSWLLHHKMPPGIPEDMQIWLYGDRGGAHWPSNQLLRSDIGSRQFIDTTLTCDQDLPSHTKECHGLHRCRRNSPCT
jgi:predicted dehydrogenase